MSWETGRRKDPACSTTEPQGLCTVRITAISHSRCATNSGQAYGGSEGDLVELNGWSSPQMLRRYGASARSARARRTQDRIMTDRP
jgi:hypothetical protein